MSKHSQYIYVSFISNTWASILNRYMFHLLVKHEQALSIDICFIYLQHMSDHSQYKKYHLLVTHEQAISIDICFI